MATRVAGRFIEPMLLLSTDALPQHTATWTYELKFDGYRAIAYKTAGRVHLRSRNDKDFNRRYPAVVKGLGRLPDDTVIDGEVLALDEDGRPSFGLLQHAGSSAPPVFYFVFDVMVYRGRDLLPQPLAHRRRVLEQNVLPLLAEPVRYAPPLEAPLPVLVTSVKAQGLEGLVAKRIDSAYEPGLRSGAWLKMRVNRGQEFVIGGYTIGTRSFDALVLGVYEGTQLVYVARTRNGFTSTMREQLFRKFRGLEIDECPFANLPEPRGGRWGEGLTKARMLRCRWLEPELVARVEFLEWTGDGHLRHTRFVGLRDDVAARSVRRE
jgi:bifunctional non-homologous end joining protein LigD